MSCSICLRCRNSVLQTTNISADVRKASIIAGRLRDRNEPLARGAAQLAMLTPFEDPTISYHVFYELIDVFVFAVLHC